MAADDDNRPTTQEPGNPLPRHIPYIGPPEPESAVDPEAIETAVYVKERTYDGAILRGRRTVVWQCSHDHPSEPTALACADQAVADGRYLATVHELRPRPASG